MTDQRWDLRTEGLALIAKGLTDALGELKELGMIGEAGAGRGFNELVLSGLELGHEGLTGDFKSFCDRWEWGVRSLINEGNNFALETNLAAGTYYETDQYVSGALKVGANSLVGDPHASEADVEKMSWGQWANSTENAYLHPDYSKKSFEDAWANSKQNLEDAGRDVATSQMLGPLSPGPETFGMSKSEYAKFLDDAFGPSPEARAQAAGQQEGEG
ncbi:hypothetical protein ACFYZB_36140 [Streptomyces sp. NPDC001852]|uniref:hypothetical protein n=1 Tax=Streptomyces sp. NPDC001852 TaxID=3364619 RepID=UPI00367518B8